MKKKVTMSSLILAIVMLCTMWLPTLAANVYYEAPTEPMTVDENIITIAAHSQGYVTPEVLGLNNYTSRQSEIPDNFIPVAEAAMKPMLGVFGSDINDSPNPYMYNYFYNCYANENGLTLADQYTLSKGLSGGGPASADLNIIEEYGTSTSLYLRPDILLGDNGNKAYTELIAALPENTDSDTANDYNPYQVSYLTASTYNFLDTMYTLAEISKEINTETGKTGRYGDIKTIVINIEKYVKGLNCYVLENLAKDGAEQKVVAVIDGINSADGIFLAHNENTSSQGTTTECRGAAYVADTTINVLDVLGYTEADIKTGGSTEKGASLRAGATFYVLTAEEILQADYIITAGAHNSDVDEEAFRELLISYIDPSDTELVEKAETIPMLSQRFNCVGSVAANSCENLLGMAYWTAWCYPEYLNPIYVATYWYENFYHITDADSLQTSISTNFAGTSIPEGYGFTTDLSGYDPSAIENMVISGMLWYEDNEASLKDTLLYTQGGTSDEGWTIDWTIGIGSDYVAEKPATTTQPVVTTQPAAATTQPVTTTQPVATTQPAATDDSPISAWVWAIICVVAAALVVVIIVVIRKSKG